MAFDVVSFQISIVQPRLQTSPSDSPLIPAWRARCQFWIARLETDRVIFRWFVGTRGRKVPNSSTPASPVLRCRCEPLSLGDLGIGGRLPAGLPSGSSPQLPPGLGLIVSLGGGQTWQLDRCQVGNGCPTSKRDCDSFGHEQPAVAERGYSVKSPCSTDLEFLCCRDGRCTIHLLPNIPRSNRVKLAKETYE